MEFVVVPCIIYCIPLTAPETVWNAMKLKKKNKTLKKQNWNGGWAKKN